METLNKNKSGPMAVSMLVIGTEARQIVILDPSGTSDLHKIQLPSVPVFLNIVGEYEIEYRIAVTCRDGNIYSIKKHKVIGTVLELETPPVAVTIANKLVVAACMDNIIHAFHFKGKKSYSIYLSDRITNICTLTKERNRKNDVSE